MTKKHKKINWQNFIYFLILSSMVIALIGTCVIMALAPSIDEGALPHERVKSDYVLILLQCTLGIAAMFLPSMLRNKWRLIIPSKMLIIYAVFLYCAIILGEVRNFYYLVPHWDTILHTSSGVMLGALGFSLVSILNDSDKIPVNLSPAFIAVFAFCFAVALGSVWEIYEFLMDLLAGTNMQKFMLENGEKLVGQAALADTMKDIIVDTTGAFVIAVIGYISHKHKTGWLDKMQISIDKNND